MQWFIVVLKNTNLYKWSQKLQVAITIYMVIMAFVKIIQYYIGRFCVSTGESKPIRWQVDKTTFMRFQNFSCRIYCWVFKLKIKRFYDIIHKNRDKNWQFRFIFCLKTIITDWNLIDKCILPFLSWCVKISSNLRNFDFFNFEIYNSKSK